MKFEGQIAQALKNIGLNNQLKRKLNEGKPLDEGEQILQDYVETSEAVIRQFLPEGLGKDLHFDYRGVKVYQYGNREKEKAMTVDQKLHGV